MAKSFPVLEFSDFQTFYGEFFQRGFGLDLNSNNVPTELRALMHYAAFWGETDDGYRDQLVRSAPRDIQENLAQVVEGIYDELDEWLAGPESKVNSFSKEYLAFLSLSLAADLAGVLARKRQL